MGCLSLSQNHLKDAKRGVLQFLYLSYALQYWSPPSILIHMRVLSSKILFFDSISVKNLHRSRIEYAWNYGKKMIQVFSKQRNDLNYMWLNI